eukprot:546840-Hanusia_phi.AAC.1
MDNNPEPVRSPTAVSVAAALRLTRSRREASTESADRTLWPGPLKRRLSPPGASAEPRRAAGKLRLTLRKFRLSTVPGRRLAVGLAGLRRARK